DDTLRRVQGFSGGERSRLALAKLLLEPRNLLFLDEPTNHLDIPAAEILEEALSSFEGTAVIVSHDRRFLEGTTTRLLAIRDGRVEIYPGGFRDYEAHVERIAKAAAAAQAEENAAPAAREAQGQKGDGRGGRAVKRSAATVPTETEDPAAKRRAFEAEKAQARALERKKKRVRDLEDEIAKGEEKLEQMREELKKDPMGDWAKLAELVKEEQALAKRVEAAMTEWMALSEELTAGGQA
ncbi:MAG: ATP-binding cassette domain-containing protein, partial [Polyangiaceae bacterium]|nr:ATP-binding cassette domain-containing protein [Polyangiaceae bacterium]